MGKTLLLVAGVVVTMLFMGPQAYAGDVPAAATSTAEVSDAVKPYIGSWNAKNQYGSVDFTIVWADDGLKLTEYIYVDREGKQNLTGRAQIVKAAKDGYLIRGTTLTNEPFSIEDLKPSGKDRLGGWVQYRKFSNPATYSRVSQ